MKSSHTRTNTLGKVYKIRLKKGDNVAVRAGKYKGQTGVVTAVHPRLNKVTVDGINVVKKHIKPSRTHPKGDIVELTKPIWVCKVGIIDPSTKKLSKIGYKTVKGAAKSRIFKGSGKEIKS